QLLDELKHAEHGRVVVGTGMIVGSYLLPTILSRFKREHPEAEIVVRFGDWDAVCADLLSGAMEYGVLIARDLPVGLEMEIVGTDEMVFTCGPTHHLASRAQVPLAKLASESFILPPKDSSY